MGFESFNKHDTAENIESERLQVKETVAKNAGLEAADLDTFSRTATEGNHTVRFDGKIKGVNVQAVGIKQSEKADDYAYTVRFTGEMSGERAIDQEITGEPAKKLFNRLNQGYHDREDMNRGAASAAQHAHDRELLTELLGEEITDTLLKEAPKS